MPLRPGSGSNGLGWVCRRFRVKLGKKRRKKKRLGNMFSETFKKLFSKSFQGHF